jgi:outer membrane protein assembly factor BamB
MWRAVVLAIFTAVAAVPAWPQTRGNAHHSNEAVSVAGPDVSSQKLLWQRSVVSPKLAVATSSIVTDSGTSAYAYTVENSLISFDTTSGDLLWQLNSTNSPVGDPIRAFDSIVLFHGKDWTGGVIANTGAIAWQLNVSAVASSVVDGADIAYFCTTNALVAVHVGDGQLVWNTSFVPDCTQGTTLSWDNATVFVTGNVSLTAVSVKNGTKLWSIALDSAPSFPVSASSDNHAVALTTTGVYAYDASTGAQVWRYNITGGRGHNLPLLLSQSHQAVLFDNNSLIVLNASTGHLVQQYFVSAFQSVLPPIADGSQTLYVIANGDEPTLLALTSQPHVALSWTFTLPVGNVTRSPVLSSTGGLILASMNGEVVCIGSPTAPKRQPSHHGASPAELSLSIIGGIIVLLCVVLLLKSEWSRWKSGEARPGSRGGVSLRQSREHAKTPLLSDDLT